MKKELSIKEYLLKELEKLPPPKSDQFAEHVWDYWFYLRIKVYDKTYT